MKNFLQISADGLRCFSPIVEANTKEEAEKIIERMHRKTLGFEADASRVVIELIGNVVFVCQKSGTITTIQRDL